MHVKGQRLGHTSRNMDTPDSLDSGTLNRVLQFIDRHLDADLEVEKLADLTGLSASCFARLFKQQVQIAPHAYIVRARVERARQLLLNTEMPLAEVALEVGFSSQACLNVAYKIHFGETPGSLRQHSRKPKDTTL